MENEKNEVIALPSKTKAALLMCLFQKEVAQNIMSHLDYEDQMSIYTEISNIKNVTEYQPEIIEFVLNEYLDYLEGNDLMMFNGGPDYARDLLGENVSSDQLEEQIRRLYSTGKKPFEEIKQIRDLNALVVALYDEDPYTVALVISMIKPSQAAEVLEKMPESKRVEVVKCVASLDQTSSEAITTIERYLNEQLKTVREEDNNITDGIKTIVNILNNVTRTTEKSIFENLEKVDPKLTQEIKDNMFVFEDLVMLSERQFQTVVNKITDDEIIVKALRAATEEMKERFYRSMTSARKEIIKEVEERMDGVRQTDAFEAQQQIATIVKELEKNGEIVIQRGEEDVIL